MYVMRDKKRIYTIRISPMYYIIAKRTSNGDIPLMIKESFQEVIDAIKELCCPPYVYEQLVIYDCDKSPIKAKYIDGKIMVG